MKINGFLITLTIVIFLQNNSWATMTNNIAPSSVSSDWYYTIGGGQTIATAPHTSSTSFGINGSAMWNMNASCGNFNFNTSVSGFMNNIRTEADTAINSMVTAATGFVASLPALILQRANPGLYDLLQNGIHRAEEQFSVAIKSCEEMENDFAAGKNPFDDFITTSKKLDWKAAKSSGGDVITAKQNIDNNAGDLGVPSMGGVMKGGVGQNAIEIIRDTSFAGYNIIMDRAPTTTTAPGVAGGRMAELFHTPEAMSQFANDVLGDMIVRTCQGCQSVRSLSGKGLMPKLDGEISLIRTDLSNLVAAAGNPVYSDLDDVSAQGIRITPRVLNALREEEPAEQAILLNKISSDIGMANLLERALILRRVLHSGKTEPNISNSETSQKIIKDKLVELNKEIENMMFETEMRKKVSTNTIQMLMARKRARDNATTGLQKSIPQPSIMTDGAVQ